MTTHIYAQDVLDFWFGHYALLHPAHADAPAHLEATATNYTALWFQKSDQTDLNITERFLPLLAPSALPVLHSWRDTPAGRVASTVVVDQFSRNMFRGQSRAFAADYLAQSWALESIALGDLDTLPALLQVFLLLPLEHAEDVGLQDQSVGLFESLQAKHPGCAALANLTEFARKHQVIIERFGRFPHRNAALNRSSTAEEQAFLKQPGSGF